MKRLLLLASVALLAAGCGTSNRVVQENDVVDIGYGVVDRKDVTTSVSRLNVERNEVQTYSNIYDYLRGRVPGVTVGADNKIIIRGVGTNTSSTDPLILVDGVPMTDISGINPTDVESVDVIKDGSSAIYGMQGANGVIIITTRKN